MIGFLVAFAISLAKKFLAQQGKIWTIEIKGYILMLCVHQGRISPSYLRGHHVLSCFLDGVFLGTSALYVPFQFFHLFELEIEVHCLIFQKFHLSDKIFDIIVNRLCKMVWGIRITLLCAFNTC